MLEAGLYLYNNVSQVKEMKHRRVISKGDGVVRANFCAFFLAISSCIVVFQAKQISFFYYVPFSTSSTQVSLFDHILLSV